MRWREWSEVDLAPCQSTLGEIARSLHNNTTTQGVGVTPREIARINAHTTCPRGASISHFQIHNSHSLFHPHIHARETSAHTRNIPHIHVRARNIPHIHVRARQGLPTRSLPCAWPNYFLQIPTGHSVGMIFNCNGRHCYYDDYLLQRKLGRGLAHPLRVESVDHEVHDPQLLGLCVRRWLCRGSPPHIYPGGSHRICVCVCVCICVFLPWMLELWMLELWMLELWMLELWMLELWMLELCTRHPLCARPLGR